MTDDVKEEDDDFEIEVVDDTPEEDKGRPRRAEGTEADIPADDDLEQHSDGVRKRIQKLKYEFHEERRQKEEASRLRDEAIEFAKRQKDEADTLRARLTKGDETIISQAQQRVKSELEQAQVKLKASYEAGDSDGVVDANTKLARLAAEAARLADYRPRPTQQPAQQAAPQRPATQQPPPPSQRAQEWAGKNAWFGKDEEMTALAFGVHERVIREGVAPDSETYYTQIDTAIKQRFPEKAVGTEASTPRRQPSSVVAPGGRSTATTPRKIVLTQTQVSLARRLGLSPEQYAAQIIKEQKNG
jgi:hypothetical protein